MLKMLGLLPVVLVGGGGTFKRCSLLGGLQVIGYVPLEGNVRPQHFSFAS